MTSIDRSDGITLSAAAHIAGCSHDSMMRWVEEGRVEGWRYTPRGWYWVSHASLIRYLNQHANGGAAQNFHPRALP